MVHTVEGYVLDHELAAIVAVLDKHSLSKDPARGSTVNGMVHDLKSRRSPSPDNANFLEIVRRPHQCHKEKGAKMGLPCGPTNAVLRALCGFPDFGTGPRNNNSTTGSP